MYQDYDCQMRVSLTVELNEKHNTYNLTIGAPNVMIDIHLKLSGRCLKVHTVSLNLKTKKVN